VRGNVIEVNKALKKGQRPQREQGGTEVGLNRMKEGEKEKERTTKEKSGD